MKIMIVKDRNALNTKFLVQFANQLAAIGHEVHVVCDSYRKPGSGELLDSTVRFTNLSACRKHPITKLFAILKKHLTIPSFRFRRIIKSERPDIIICYFPIDLYNVRFLQRNQPPVILMIHNYPPVVFEKIKSKSRLVRSIYKNLIEQVDGLQVLNKSFEKTIAAYYRVKNITTIGNAVKQFEPADRADLAHPKNRIIYVGRISKSGKRQHLLIDAFAKVAQRFPEWELVFWGLEKSQRYKDELNKQIEDNGLSGRVLIKGYTRDITEEYRKADINAFPSLHEGFGLGLADGMALGLPSIGFKYTPSVNELIIDGKNGYLVEDLDEFSDKLALLMANKELRMQLGQQAAKDMEKFSPEKIIREWDALLHKTIDLA